MIAVLLSITAIIAYMMGSLNTTIIASHFVFHCDLFAYSRDNVGITKFEKRFGKKGMAILLGMEAVKSMLPVLIGGWLMSIVDQAVLGRCFALFCVMMGTTFPIMFKFKGEPSIVAFAAGLLCVKLSMGLAIIAIGAAVYFISRYVSLTAISGAFLAFVISIVSLEGEWTHRLLFLCFVIVLIEYRKSIVPIIKGTEPKFIYKKDISYMFDDDF